MPLKENELRYIVYNTFFKSEQMDSLFKASWYPLGKC